MPTLLASLALAVAVVALGLAVWAARTAAPVRRRRAGELMPADVDLLRDEVQHLRDEAAQTVRHIATLRYDAFGDMGGHLSWTVAMLDDHGDGLLLTSIHGRADSRTYAKVVAGWSCEQQLSPEESEALAAARPA